MAKVTRLQAPGRDGDSSGQPLGEQLESALSDISNPALREEISSLLRNFQYAGATRALFRWFQRSGRSEEGL